MANVVEEERLDTVVPDDVSWLRASFLLPRQSVGIHDVVDRNRSSADDKYVNASLGGNFAVNVPPQFTHIADPRIIGIAEASGTHERPSPMDGLGRYYSEALDDNSQVITLRFGTLQYSSLLGFLSRAYNVSYAKMARSGVGMDSFGYKMGEIAGFAVLAPVIPSIMLIRGALKLIGFGFKAGGGLAQMIFGTTKIPASRYVYMKTGMAAYWATVNHMVNTLAVNMGLIPAATFFDEGKDGTPSKKEGQWSSSLSDEDAKGLPLTDSESANGVSIESFNRLLPGFMRDSKYGGINVRSIIGRAERIRVARAIKINNKLDELLASGAQSELDALTQSYRESWKMWMADDYNNATPENDRADSYGYLRRIVEENISNEKPASTDPETGEELDDDSTNSWVRQFGDAFSIDTLAGANWVTFRVTGDKTVNESFQNDIGESSVAAALKSKTGRSRDAEYGEMAGGISSLALSELSRGFKTKIRETMASMASDIGLGGFGAALGGAYLDFPNMWKDSTANLPKMDYTIELRATYGNKMSVFTDIYIPLCMLLGGTIPLSAGKASYVSPFVCEVYHKGRAQSRLAMIENVSISRGVGNLGWSVDDLPLGIDVTLSIADLTNIIHVPIDHGMGTYDDDSGYSNYLAVLGSLGYIGQTEFLPRFSRRKARFFQDVTNALDPSTWGINAADTLPARSLNHMVKHIGNIVAGNL